MKSKIWITMALTVMGLWSATVHADEDVRNATSDERFKEGLAALEAGKYEQARASFLQVLAVTPQKRTVLLNLAIAEHAGGHYVEALEHLKAYRANPKADLNRDRDIKQELYDELWKTTGHLKVSADRGDDITVNGEAKGKAPLRDVVDVMPGRYRLAAGGRTVDVTISAGETKDVNLASPVVKVSKEAKESYWMERHIVGVAAGGLTVVAAGVGVGFLAARSGHVSDANSTASDICSVSSTGSCRQFGDARDSAKTSAIVSGVSFGVAVALGVTTAILLWPRKENSRVQARVAPTGQGILIDGSF